MEKCMSCKMNKNVEEFISKNKKVKNVYVVETN